MRWSLSVSSGSADRSGGPAGRTYRVLVPVAHMSRCDGSWDNYLPSGCVCNCKMEQGFPSGSPPAQVSEQIMTFLSGGMKEVTVVCSQLHTTALLLSAVCLNLPAAFFTPQGDHVIRFPPLLVCHPAAPLLQRGTAGAAKGKTMQTVRRPQHQMFIVYWLRVSCNAIPLLGITAFVFIFSLQDLKRI